MDDDLSSRIRHLAHRHKWIVERLGELASDPGDDPQRRQRMVTQLVDEALAIDNDFIDMADRLSHL